MLVINTQDRMDRIRTCLYY